MRLFEAFFRAAPFHALLGAVCCCAVSSCPGLAAPRAGAQTSTELLAQNYRGQNYGAPPEDIGSDGGGQDASSLLLRIDRLEGQMRQLNGQIEQLQFQNRKLEDRLKKFQDDVDFRFQDSGRGATGTGAPPSAKPQKRSDAIDDLITDDQSVTTAGAPAATTATPGPARSRRGDAFDPAADPNASGAPRSLGSPLSASSPKDRAAAVVDPPGPDAPLDLSGAKWRGARPGEPARSPATPSPSNPAVAALTTPNGVAPGATPINPVKEEFDVAYGYFRQKEYENAEKSFSAFIQKNPRNRLTADATFYLGESFFQRNRPREAADQYLKIATQYASSARAPDAMLRLGQ